MSQPSAQEDNTSANNPDEQPRDAAVAGDGAGEGAGGGKKKKNINISWPALKFSMGNLTVTFQDINLSRLFRRKKKDSDGPPETTFKEAFKLYKKEYFDIWASLLFLLNVLAFVALSSFVTDRYAKGVDFDGHIVNDPSNSIALDLNVVLLLSAVLPLAVSASVVYFLIFLFFTDKLVWVTGLLNVSASFGTGAVYLYRRQWAIGGVFTGLGLFAVIYFVNWIPRIPFTTVLLRSSAAVIRRHGSVNMICIMGSMLTVGFAALLFVTLVTTYIAFDPDETKPNPLCYNYRCKSIATKTLMTFSVLSAYWITEWIKNTMHATVAGAYGSWYFYGGNSKEMPTRPLRSASRRAITYSFGSICLGSLVVGVVDLLRQLCSISGQEVVADQTIVGRATTHVREIMSSLRRVTSVFNRYAFSHVVLYGKPYGLAAKYTWQMMEHHGIDALVNDSIAATTITLGSLFVAYLCAFVAYVELGYTTPDFNRTGRFTPAIMAYAFLCGFQICKVYMTPVVSGVDTTFMAMGLDPEVLVTQHPDLWEALLRVYPRIQDRINP
ncbi:conserved hypothetical protein [Histoplasma capsulatum var. duboisii H88]|uniref:Protein PNS1 n=2 Tax=Ajellomyces capsulatus TaxID=5037 RepID=F0URC9_AJEC8|nr:pns1 [Histoplasma capsulatum H143]EGC48456.1 conserved hypothetical protein [Histoplasma capsulatum var. duboisii H88]QSS50477.1 plasma-membrane choline transporter [Histoplasma capsulatum var. duboisii H88]